MGVKRVIRAAAFVSIMAGCQVHGATIGPEKKIIEWGWDQPDPAYMRANIAQMEKAPFDGVIFGVRAWTKDGPIYFSHENWGRRLFTEEELRPAMEELRATNFEKFTENFMRPGLSDRAQPRAARRRHSGYGASAAVPHTNVRR